MPEAATLTAALSAEPRPGPGGAASAAPALQSPSVQGRAARHGQTLAARLAALPAPAPGVLDPARAAARTRLLAMDLPGARDEYWRYTDPAPFNAPHPDPVPVEIEATPLFAEIDRLRMVFVDGLFDPAASDDLAAEGIEIVPLSALPSGHWAADAYGALETQGQSPVPRPFAALNTAMAQDGAAIRVTGRVTRPVEFIYRHADPGADALCHHVIRLEPDSALTVLEIGQLGARGNLVIEADLAAGAALHRVSAVRAGAGGVTNSAIFARLAGRALLKSFVLSVDGRHMRHEAVAELVGDDAAAHLAGAALADAADAPLHHDDTVFVTHGALRGESRQVFKKVLKNGAVGVFQGKILVRAGAQKTDGYQISQALLLDEGSQFLGKPELEIYADDVRCSHGSTTGAIDPLALFYLRSRGVPRGRAEVLLVLSFLADALAEIEDEGLRDRIAERLDEWLTLSADADDARALAGAVTER